MVHLCFMTNNTFSFIFISTLCAPASLSGWIVNGAINVKSLEDRLNQPRVYLWTNLTRWTASLNKFNKVDKQMDSAMPGKRQHLPQTIWKCQNYDEREEALLPWLVFRTITYLRSLDLDHQAVILVDRVHAECDPYEPEKDLLRGEILMQGLWRLDRGVDCVIDVLFPLSDIWHVDKPGGNWDRMRWASIS